MNQAIKYLVCVLFFSTACYSQGGQVYLKAGWNELVKDNDAKAMLLFSQALDSAEKYNNVPMKAEALLNLGIAAYGSSLFNGMIYATKALQAYESLTSTNERLSVLGRAKCLVLIATIKGRQNKYSEARAMALEALKSSQGFKDSSSTTGLAHYLLGTVYRKLGKEDSADYHIKAALEVRRLNNETTYLPLSYAAVDDIFCREGLRKESYEYYKKGLDLAEQTQNRQAQISLHLSLSKWAGTKSGNQADAFYHIQLAKTLAEGISDKSYLAKVLSHLKEYQVEMGQFKEALAIEEQLVDLKEAISESEKEHLTKSLEVQFGLAEKERELNLVKKEKELSTLTNYLLYTALFAVIIIAGGTILFLRRLHNRDQEILQSKDALFELAEQQKKLKEQQLRNEIEFKESQLSALTIQMIQKNELLHELKEKLETNSDQRMDSSVAKLLNKGLNQDKEWADFNTHFESINKNFYTRIKQSFPEISPNELKICALIKMNLSIKEMASILNISPDSVKTARYRLRKKLNLSTEDNLTEFILALH